jgi:hypothetical protein
MKIQTVTDLVKTIKIAIQEAQRSLDVAGLRIENADLEIKTKLVTSVEGGVKFKVVPVDLSGSYETRSVHTISMSLEPGPVPTLKLFADLSDELKDAVEAIGNAVREAAQSSPVFQLSEAKVQIEFGITADGGIQFVVGGKGGRDSSQSVTLTLKRKDSANH